MGRNIFKLDNGINIHFVHTDKFKTNYINVSIDTLLTLENASKNALILMILRQVSKKYNTQRDFSIALDNLYGASFASDIQKLGDSAVLRFNMEVVNDKFLPTENSEILKNALDVLFNMIFNPNIVDNKFDAEILNVEKENLKDIINSKVDDKDGYAFCQAVEKMYGKNGYGIYRYGYIEDVDKVNGENLYSYYKELMESANINIGISGDFDEKEIFNFIKEDSLIKNLERKNINLQSTISGNYVDKVLIENEYLDVTQGKMVLGYTIEENFDKILALGNVYNGILGDGANSMLFQNVREKASLCYTIKSIYYNQKKSLFIRCGIEHKNYQKALDLIEVQLKNIENGNFTDEEFENSKVNLKSFIDSIREEQDSEMIFYLNQEVTKKYFTLEEYISDIDSITREDIIKFAKAIKLRIIYFLTNDSKKGEE